MEYVEQECCIDHEGRTFCAGGAVVNGVYAVDYMARDLRSVTAWHGQTLGTARVVSSWPIRSYMSGRAYQVEATIDGVRYTGRTLGDGMIWKGKRSAKQPTVAA